MLTAEQWKALGSEWGIVPMFYGDPPVVRFECGPKRLEADQDSEKLTERGIRLALEREFGPPIAPASLDFSNHPVSLSEAKAEREKDGRLWTPRDALVNLLRDIDSGKTKPTDLVICYLEREENGSIFARYLSAVRDLITASGLLSRIQYRINRDLE